MHVLSTRGDRWPQNQRWPQNRTRRLVIDRKPVDLRSKTICRPPRSIDQLAGWAIRDSVCGVVAVLWFRCMPSPVFLVVRWRRSHDTLGCDVTRRGLCAYLAVSDMSLWECCSCLGSDVLLITVPSISNFFICWCYLGSGNAVHLSFTALIPYNKALLIVTVCLRIILRNWRWKCGCCFFPYFNRFMFVLIHFQPCQ